MKIPGHQTFGEVFSYNYCVRFNVLDPLPLTTGDQFLLSENKDCSKE